MGGYGIFRDCMILWREEVCHFVSVSLFEHILFSFTLSCNYLSFFFSNSALSLGPGVRASDGE